MMPFVFLRLRRLICWSIICLFPIISFTQSATGDTIAVFNGNRPSLPNNNGVFLVPTGLGLKKGSLNYQNFTLFLHQLQYGASDEFSIGMTFEWLSLLAAIDSMRPYSPAFSLNPKVSIPIREDELYLGLGALFMEIPDTDVFMDLGFVLGTLTYGKQDRNVSLGLGFGLVEGGFSVQPILLFSGQYRFSRRWALVTENGWIPNPFFGFSNTGIRILGKRVHWDLGLTAIGVRGETAQQLPMLGLIVPFGH